MPKVIEDKLKKQARKAIKGKGKAAKRRRDAYVYGTMNKIEKAQAKKK